MLSNKKTGFTIVELIVVISVIGILLTLSVFSFGNWRQRTAQNEVQSDLKGAMSAMESVRNFSTGYPTQTANTAFSLSTFDESTNVDLWYISGDATYYCLRARSTPVTSVTYYVKPPTITTPTTTVPTCP